MPDNAFDKYSTLQSEAKDKLKADKAKAKEAGEKAAAKAAPKADGDKK